MEGYINETNRVCIINEEVRLSSEDWKEVDRDYELGITNSPSRKKELFEEVRYLSKEVVDTLKEYSGCIREGSEGREEKHNNKVGEKVGILKESGYCMREDSGGKAGGHDSKMGERVKVLKKYYRRLRR